jgi:hypothetical protein
LLDKFHQYGRHIDALCSSCGLKCVVKPRFNIDVHAFYP